MTTGLDVVAQKLFFAWLSARFLSLVPSPSIRHTSSMPVTGSLVNGMRQPGWNSRSEALSDARRVAAVADVPGFTGLPGEVIMESTRGIAPAAVARAAFFPLTGRTGVRFRPAVFGFLLSGAIKSLAASPNYDFLSGVAAPWFTVGVGLLSACEATVEAEGPPEKVLGVEGPLFWGVALEVSFGCGPSESGLTSPLLI